MYQSLKCFLRGSNLYAKMKARQECLDSARVLLADQPPHGYNLPGRLAIYKKLEASAQTRSKDQNLDFASGSMGVSRTTGASDDLVGKYMGAHMDGHADEGAECCTSVERVLRTGACATGKAIASASESASVCSVRSSSGSASSSSLVLSSLHSSELSNVQDIVLPKARDIIEYNSMEEGY